MHAPFFFSSIQPYPPFAIAVFGFYLEFMWEGATHALLWSMPHFSCCYKPSLFKHTGGGGTSQASLFIYSSLRECPSPILWTSGRPALFALYLFFLAAFLFSLFFSLFFPLGGGQSVQGAMLIWPRVVCGSTICCLAHLVVCFSQAD
jgi:hypothetical protein